MAHPSVQSSFPLSREKVEVEAYTFVSVNKMGTTDCDGMDAYNDSLLASLCWATYVGRTGWEPDGWAISSSSWTILPLIPQGALECLYHEYQVPSLDQGPHLLRMAGMTESGSITGHCEEVLWLQKGVHDTYYMEAPQCQLR